MFDVQRRGPLAAGLTANDFINLGGAPMHVHARPPPLRPAFLPARPEYQAQFPAPPICVIHGLNQEPWHCEECRAYQ
eukprot:14088673-Heterocapsa_arctica.AAC.1